MTSEKALNIIKHRIELDKQNITDILGDDIFDLLDPIKKDLDRLEKLEKAIEIIKTIKPSIFIRTLENYRNVYKVEMPHDKTYVSLYYNITKEEYELLKEVLVNE